MILSAGQYANQILTGDNRELIRQLPDASVDVVLGSPPYNLGRAARSGIQASPLYPDNALQDPSLDPDEYIARIVAFCKEAERVVKLQGTLILVMGYGVHHGAQQIWDLFSAIGRQTQWYAQDAPVWKKDRMGPAGIHNNPVALDRRVEYIGVFMRKEMKPQSKAHHSHVNKQLNDKGNAFLSPAISTFIEAPSGNQLGDLKATFSEELVDKLLQTYAPLPATSSSSSPANNNATVLDPWMGSGTTAIACKRLGLNYVGFEIHAPTAAAARQRVGKITAARL